MSNINNYETWRRLNEEDSNNSDGDKLLSVFWQDDKLEKMFYLHESVSLNEPYNAHMLIEESDTGKDGTIYFLDTVDDPGNNGHYFTTNWGKKVEFHGYEVIKTMTHEDLSKYYDDENAEYDKKHPKAEDISYEDFRSELDNEWTNDPKRQHVNDFSIIHKDNYNIKLRISLKQVTDPNREYDLNDPMKRFDNIKFKANDDELGSMSNSDLQVLIDKALDAKDMDEVKRLAGFLNESNMDWYKLSHIVITNQHHETIGAKVPSYSDALDVIANYVKNFELKYK